MRVGGALVRMYLTIPRSSMGDDYSTDEEQEVTAHLRRVLGIVVLLFECLSAAELERLLFQPAPTGGKTVQDILSSLHAILDVPNDLQEPIRMQHLSFRDFLVDYTRCDDNRLHVDQRRGTPQFVYSLSGHNGKISCAQYVSPSQSVYASFGSVRDSL